MYPACILEISTHKNRSEKKFQPDRKTYQFGLSAFDFKLHVSTMLYTFSIIGKKCSNPVRRHGTSPDNSHKSVRIKRLPHKFRKPVQIPFSGHVIKISGKDVPGKAV